MSYKRLRQVCLVAHSLDEPVRQLTWSFGLTVAWREPQIAHLGLCNVILPVGDTPVFLEIVSPIRPGTAAGRYLDRRGGDGGYMFITDTSDLAAAQARADGLGMRTISANTWSDSPSVSSFQLHPQDTGGAILEFDHHGSDDDLSGPYRWAGPDWRAAVRRRPARALLGVEVQSDRPQELCQHWANLLGVESVSGDADPELWMDNAFARFTRPGDARGEGISAIHLSVDDPALVRDRARSAGAPFVGEDPLICGLRWVLNP